MDLHKLLREGAALSAARPIEITGEAPGETVSRIKREHLEWEHIDGLLSRSGPRGATPDDLRAMREDLLEAGVQLLALAGALDWLPAKGMRP